MAPLVIHPLMRRNPLAIFCALLVTFAATIAMPTGQQEQSVNVLTHHNDNGRTGANLNETTLNTSNVSVSQFGKLFARDVDGQIYAQPLYVSNLNMGALGTRNVVLVATEKNNI